MQVLWKLAVVRGMVLTVMTATIVTICGCGGSSSSSSGSNVTATPTFNPGAGSYSTAQTVTMSDATSGAVLYCTTDGTTPTTSSPKCSQPTTVYQTEFLQAIAVAPGKSASAVASAGYVINPKAAPTPTFNPTGGTYTGAQQVTVSDSLSGANIYYTLDGSTPTANSTLYTSPISIAQSETLSAIAVSTGYANSGVVSAAYTIQPATGTGLAISSISPNSVQPGSAGFNLTVYGTDFVEGSTVLWNSTASTTSPGSDAIVPRSIAIHAQGSAFPAAAQSNGTPLTTAFVSSTELQAAVPADLVATSASIAVSVANPDGTTTGSGPSSPTFGVGAPAIASISPSSVIVGSGGFALTVNGTTFALGSTVQWGTTTLVTTSVSSTQLMAAIPAGLVATAGSATITVTDSAGTSAAVTFIVATALPTIATLSPSSAMAGAGGFTLAVTGANFDSSARVNWNGSALTTTFVSAAQVTAAVPANLIASAGTASITVSTAAGTSGASAFTIQSGKPAITGFSPTSATAGAPAFALTVNGSNFDSSAKASWNGAALTTTFVSAVQVTAAIPANLIASAGTASITVTTTAGTSPASSFTVQAAPPTVTGTNPTSATVGGAAFTLTVNGTNFDSSAKINWNGAALTTAYVNATTVTANIPANLITSVGTVNISVTTGGGTSAVSTFPIQLGAPAIATISPTSVTVGGPAFTLTVNGTNFDSSAAVKWNGAALGTTLVSATQLKAAVPANLIAATGTANITVTTSVGTSPVAGSVAIQQAGVPTIDTLDPSSVTAGGSAFLLTVNGGGFDSSSVVKWNNTSLTTIYVSSTELQAAISADMVVSASTVSLTVSGTAGTSAPSSFLIKLGLPTIGGFSPTSANSNDPTFTILTVNGTNFDSSAVVNWNSSALTTTYVNAGRVTAAVPASLIVSPGTEIITVTTTAGKSAASDFTVNLGKPTISNTDPLSATAGGVSFTLKVTGTNFESSSKINWNGSALTTTPVNATEVDANIDSSLIASAGSAIITVSNSAGMSDTFTFIINVAPPSIKTLTPSSGAVGDTVVIAGSNFGASQSTSTVTFGGTAATVSNGSWSNGSITTTVPANATTGPVVVTVNGVPSNADQAFTVTAAGPKITGTVVAGPNGTGNSPVLLTAAQVELWSVGSQDYGKGAQLINTVNSDATTAKFSMPYNCTDAKVQNPNDLLYIVATGTNNNVVLTTALGSCSSLQSGTNYTVNEATTVASVYALQQFMAPDGTIGAAGNDISYKGLSNAFKTVNNLVNLTNGIVREYTPDYSQSLAEDHNILNNSTVPMARINTLANALNACASNGNGCSDLFAAATTSSEPANTLQAILNIAQNPGNKPQDVYDVSGGSGPFTPTLSGYPNDWTLAVTFTGGGLGFAPAVTIPTNRSGGNPSGPYQLLHSAMAIDADGNIWVTAYSSRVADHGNQTDTGSVDPTSGMIAKFNNQGKPFTSASTTTALGGYIPIATQGSSGYLNAGTQASHAIAIDPSGNAWVLGGGLNGIGGGQTGTPLGGALSEVSADLSSLKIPYINMGNIAASSVAIDGSGNVWALGDLLYEFNNDGSQKLSNSGLEGANGFGYFETQSLIFDSQQSALWASDPFTLTLYQIDPATGNNTVDYNPNLDGFGYTPLVADSMGNVYGCEENSGQELDVFNVSVTSIPTPNHPSIPTGRGCGNQMVMDGLGHIFTLTGNTSTPPTQGVVDEFTVGSSGITMISPAAGYTGTGTAGEPPVINPDPNGPALPNPASTSAASTNSVMGAAIDGSGNLWILNEDTGTTSSLGNVLVEFVGLAAPVVTPTSAALNFLQVGVRP